MKTIIKFFNWIINLFTTKCPECNGTMEVVAIDWSQGSLEGKDVYKCNDCGKEWI